MTLPRLLVLLTAVLLCLGVWWGLSGGDDKADARSSLLPNGFERAKSISGIELRGAGDTVLASLQRSEGQWTVVERQHWPAHAASVERLLRELAEARRIEAKTKEPNRYSRLAVEPVEATDAGGIELRLISADASIHVVVGDPTPTGEHRYVRLSEEVQAWRVDRALEFPESAAAWLDRQWIDRPTARIAQVLVQPARGKRFELNRVNDRFGLDALPPEALADPDRAAGTAAFLDALELDDVAVDVGQAAEQTVRFVGVDGLDVVIEAWQQGSDAWARCVVSLDEVRERAWLAPQETENAEDAKASGLRLREQLDSLRARCEGKAFNLPEYKASNLMRSREQYLAD